MMNTDDKKTQPAGAPASPLQMGTSMISPALARHLRKSHKAQQPEDPAAAEELASTQAATRPARR